MLCRATALRYMDAFHPVAVKLMHAFALALDLPLHFFDKVCTLMRCSGAILQQVGQLPTQAATNRCEDLQLICGWLAMLEMGNRPCSAFFFSFCQG